MTIGAFQKDAFQKDAFQVEDAAADAFQCNAFQFDAFQTHECPPATTFVETIYFMRHRLRR